MTQDKRNELRKKYLELNDRIRNYETRIDDIEDDHTKDYMRSMIQEWSLQMKSIFNDLKMDKWEVEHGEALEKLNQSLLLGSTSKSSPFQTEETINSWTKLDALNKGNGLLDHPLLSGINPEYKKVTSESISKTLEEMSYAPLSSSEKEIIKHIDSLIPVQKIKFFLEYTERLMSFVGIPNDMKNQHNAMLFVMGMLVAKANESKNLMSNGSDQDVDTRRNEMLQMHFRLATGVSNPKPPSGFSDLLTQV